MTIEEKIKEAVLKNEVFYIPTPTYEYFNFIITLLKDNKIKFDDVDYSNWKSYWDKYKEDTHIFFEGRFRYGNSLNINENRELLDLSEFTQEEIIEHTYTISIGEYSGKLIIPKEALQLLKNGNKIKIL